MAKILCILCPSTPELSSPVAGVLSGATSLARQSGSDLQIAILGAGREYAERCAAHCSGAVSYVAHEALATYQPDRYVAAAQAVIRELDPDLIIFPAGARENEVAPRLAARLGAGLASDCVDLRAAGDGFRFFRPVFGGKAIAEVAVRSRPALATVRSGPFAAVISEAPQPAQVQAYDVSLEEAKVRSKLIGRMAEGGEGIRLEDAKAIVSGGRGMGGPTPFGEQLAALAGLLGGAVGASRAAVDAGWVPGGLQIGQTGKTVSPNVYIAVAISGASQHIAGITAAKHVVAINSDAEAPIFGYAELGIVEHWEAALPPLIEALRQRLG